MSPRSEEQFEKIRIERKKSILLSALQIFAEEGYHSSSISKISKHAGISKGLMYNYFDSKESLLKELLSTVFEDVLSAMSIIEGDKINDKQLIKHIDCTFDLIEKNRSYWKLYFSMISQPIVAELAIEHLRYKMEPYIVSLIQYFKDKGYENPQVMMRYFGATLDGAKMQCLYDPDNFPVVQVKELIKNQFIKS